MPKNKKKQQDKNPLEDILNEDGVEVVDMPAQKEERPEDCLNCEEYKSGWMRAQADYKNLQMETSKQRSEWARMSEIQILEEFIPIYENFRTAFKHPAGEENSSWENWKKGIEFIMKQFGDVLESHGVKEMEVVGKMFDPNLHEAVSEEASEGHADGQIIRELAGGYLAGEKVLRAARVVVCKNT
ncbi:nucleotide exchange factor GrpE [Patescibacteria group bacterium]|nr:nucleotide exchange factor GrpE [Patescibacteria group bacterium]MBU1721476.1 nucleotide exchange factor GrpE [Patescibacteria group bacterium]